VFFNPDMSLFVRFAGTCRHIALVQSFRIAVASLLPTIGHSGMGSSAGSVTDFRFAIIANASPFRITFLPESRRNDGQE
jgi:hypothetical protein